MRTLLDLRQARKDKAERIYQPQAAIFVEARPYDLPTLQWTMKQLTDRFPWRDKKVLERRSKGRVYIGEPLPRTFEIDGTCAFIWRDGSNKGFYSSGDTIWLRRSQLVAFENFVSKLCQEFAAMKLPNLEIVSVRGTVEYFVRIGQFPVELFEHQKGDGYD
jgi:hypothetical protein